MTTNKTRSAAQQSRTPILDSYNTAYKYLWWKPEVARIIDRKRKLICINLAARPGANVDQLEG